VVEKIKSLPDPDVLFRRRVTQFTFVANFPPLNERISIPEI